MSRITGTQAKGLVGKPIYAVRKDGSVVTGKLVRVQGSRLIVQPPAGKKVRTSAIIPLVLFDLLAIGTLPGAYGYGGGFGGGYGGYGPGPGIGYGGGFGGGLWW